MAKILITSGPTRQFLDPVRYLTNASSGRMGCALAAAALELGHEVVVVSGPVSLEYPPEAQVVSVVTTDQMLAAALNEFPACDGLIGVAAPCDYQPIKVAEEKITKTGGPLVLHLVETPDIVATLASEKRADQWAVGFALETQDHRFGALAKLERKSCDLMILNGPAAMNADQNDVEIIDPTGAVLEAAGGKKQEVARRIMAMIQKRLIDR